MIQKTLIKQKKESNRKDIGLRYVIAGVENIGVCPIAKAKVIIPLDETRDYSEKNFQQNFEIGLIKYDAKQKTM